MTFKEAYIYAYENNPTFREHADRVNEGRTNSCMLFAIGDETFYYGHDGCGIIKGKHSPNRSAWLLDHNKCLIVKQKAG